MKKVYSALATLALLFSLPAQATAFAEKEAVEKSQEPKETEPKSKDKIKVEAPEKGAIRSPICGGSIGF